MMFGPPLPPFNSMGRSRGGGHVAGDAELEKIEDEIYGPLETLAKTMIVIAGIMSFGLIACFFLRGGPDEAAAQRARAEDSRIRSLQAPMRSWPGKAIQEARMMDDYNLVLIFRDGSTARIRSEKYSLKINDR